MHVHSSIIIVCVCVCVYVMPRTAIRVREVVPLPDICYHIVRASAVI